MATSLTLSWRIESYKKWHASCIDIVKWQLLTYLSLDKLAATFADDIFKCIFTNEKLRILIRISLEFVPKGPLDNNPALA